MSIRRFDADALISGAIDMHLHPGPDVFKCRLEALDAARQAKQAGMKAIVIKSHHFPSAPVARMVNELVPDFQVFGSVCLDYEIGGLNALALENSAKMDARVAWMPTFSSANSRSRMRALGLPLEGEGFSILDNRGELVTEIEPILKIIKRHDMVLASGHMSPQETIELQKAARNAGIGKFVVTHPLDHEFFSKPFTRQDLVQLARDGAYIECTFIAFLASEFRRDPAVMVDIIRAVGADHCIMATDLGQTFNPLPVEGLRMFIVILLKAGISEEEINVMLRLNPAKLLGLNA